MSNNQNDTLFRVSLIYENKKEKKRKIISSFDFNDKADKDKVKAKFEEWNKHLKDSVFHHITVDFLGDFYRIRRKIKFITKNNCSPILRICGAVKPDKLRKQILNYEIISNFSVSDGISLGLIDTRKSFEFKESFEELKKAAKG